MSKIHLSHNKETLSWLFMSNVVKSCAQWGILVILIKFFTTEDVGYFTLAMALAAPVFMLTDMQLKSVLIVEPFGENDNFRTYQLIRFITTSLATIGLILYCVFFRDVNIIILIIIIYKAVESSIDILYGYLQKCDKMVLMSKLDIFKTFAALALCFIFAVCTKRIALCLSALVVVSLIFYVINNYFINREATFKFNPSIKEIIGIVKKSLPLGISVFFSSYIVNYPRIAIEGMYGPSFLAYFGAYSYLAIGVFQVYIPLQIFLRQRLSIAYQNNDKKDFINKIKKTIILLILYGIFTFSALYLFGDFVIQLIYDENYLEYSSVLLLLIIAQTIVSVWNIISIAVLSFNIYTKQAFISIGVLAAVILFTNPLIRSFGIYGGGYVSIMAAVLSLICYSSIFYKKIKTWK